MNITIHNLGRRFNQEWIFRKIDYTFSSNQKYAVLGPNGSGKSTLIKTLTGQLTPSEGTIEFSLAGGVMPVEEVFHHVSIAAPYIELIEEFTLNELLDFHFKFKKYLNGFDKDAIISILRMEKSRNKELKYFSSGMKQRVKLVLACCSDTELLFLDEPTSNMDVEGETWYLDLLNTTISQNRTLIIGSNQEKEYEFCDSFVSILDYK
ncbi:ABC transporter ATP-binding protein [Sphingobacterium faecale]|uniref:ABC transporter ATP-binding protein n=1 Tax=Sphingobacterium faecale TaxID=2803775 RepID=A0ABS1R4S1_9SPHI|nr:ATP-binding cassette domain-containing protein [Sphingobacterium faecale]MBL1409692.1 ABC transporter ATP-binding protein [Sphingobacterium faecale]